MKRRPAGSLRSLWAQLRGWVSVLGPGLITGASDDDPSGISTYSIAGASTGYSMLWTAVLTTPMMAVVQGMCARIGLVCGCGLTTALGKRFPVVVVRVLVILVVLANTLNIGADIAGMGASAHLVFKPVPEALWSIGFVATMVAVEVFVAYGPFALIAKILCSALLAYVVTAFMVHVDWRMALRRAVIPEVHVTGVWISTFLGVLGTTITPYLFFWQTSLEVEERAKRQPKGTFQHDPPSAREIADAHADVNTGMAYSNLIMFFIIVTAAATLGAQHINIVTAQDAAAALRPLAGRFAELIFALGMVGAGLLAAVPVAVGLAAVCTRPLAPAMRMSRATWTSSAKPGAPSRPSSKLRAPSFMTASPRKSPSSQCEMKTPGTSQAYSAAWRSTRGFATAKPSSLKATAPASWRRQ